MLDLPKARFRPTEDSVRADALSRVVSDFTRKEPEATVILGNLLAKGWHPAPFLNMALIVSLVVTIGMTAVVFLYGAKRTPGTPLSWGEAVVGAVWVYAILFLAYGVVPHQFLTHADNELAWRKDVLVFGPGNILKPKSSGGHFPFTINAVHVRDLVATVIYIVFLGMHMYVWSWWQKRGKAKAAGTAVATSSYGRPLVKKA